METIKAEEFLFAVEMSLFNVLMETSITVDLKPAKKPMERTTLQLFLLLIGRKANANEDL